MLMMCAGPMFQLEESHSISLGIKTCTDHTSERYKGRYEVGRKWTETWKCWVNISQNKTCMTVNETVYHEKFIIGFFLVLEKEIMS